MAVLCALFDLMKIDSMHAAQGALRHGVLIGQIKNTRSHVQCCLSAGCASNKQQCISLRCPMIRQPRHPKGRQTAKLALFRDVLRFSSGVSDHHRQSQSRKDWWSQTGSNRRHPACKAGALPAELWPQPILSPACTGRATRGPRQSSGAPSEDQVPMQSEPERSARQLDGGPG